MLNEAAELALRRLDDVDGLVDVAGDDQMVVGKYLRSDVDLKQMLAQHDQELMRVKEEYIEEHCKQAERLCSLYVEVTECEEKLLDFEKQINDFQTSLTNTAEDIVVMQQQTVDLVHRIGNRRHVSSKISEVYGALKECEEFCEGIAKRQVDADYLANIRELESKIAFLANNKELENSAVDQEISPKLRAAAHKAGDKLQRYLSKKITALSENMTNITMQQQALQSTGQHAYGFLARYNTPVAQHLLDMYIRIMADVYIKQTRSIMREVLEGRISPQTAVLSHEDAMKILENRDSGSPPGSEVTTKQTIKATMVINRERSLGIEQRVRELMRSRDGTQLREVTINDIVLALRSIDVQYGVVSIDPSQQDSLRETQSYVFRFVRAMAHTSNLTINESKFISEFFHGHCHDSDAEESVTRTVLGKSLQVAETSVKDLLNCPTDRSTTLACLRAVDLVKSLLCQCSNPLPLLLMSVIVELVTGTLRGRIYNTLNADWAILEEASALALIPFKYDATGPLKRLLDADRNFASYIAVHPVIARFASTTGELHVINTYPLAHSRVDGALIKVFDDVVSGMVKNMSFSVMRLIDHLGRRHVNDVAYRVFCIRNLFHVLHRWRSLSAQFAGEREGYSAVADHHREALEANLKTHIAYLIQEEANDSSIGKIFCFAVEAEAALGTDFFRSSDVPTLASLGLPDAINEASTLGTISAFSSGWQDHLLSASQSIEKYFSSQGNQDAPDELEEIASIVLREYFQSLLDSYAKVLAVIKVFYSKNGAIQAKVVGSVALFHEVQKYVSQRRYGEVM
jgi:hypothetical protein